MRALLRLGLLVSVALRVATGFVRHTGVRRGGLKLFPARPRTSRCGRSGSTKMGLADFWKNERDVLKECGSLVFDVNELLLPGQTRYLHLFEARFISLFEEAMKDNHNVFAFAFSSGAGELLRVVTLVEIDDYQKLSVGVGVTVRGVGRALIEQIPEVEPYIKTRILPYDDQPIGDSPALDIQSAEVAEQIYQLHEGLLTRERDTKIASSVSKELAVDPRALLTPPSAAPTVEANVNDESPDLDSLRTRVRVARMAQTKSISVAPSGYEAVLERALLSFLALEGCDLERKLKAFHGRSTVQRLQICRDAVDERSKILAAKNTIRTLNLSWDKESTDSPLADDRSDRGSERERGEDVV